MKDLKSKKTAPCDFAGRFYFLYNIDMKWLSWVTLVLGVWLIVSPFVLGYWRVTSALWSQMVVGVLISLIALWQVVEGGGDDSDVN